MPKFSIQSQAKLDSCCKELQLLFEEVIKGFDCTIICGNRNEAEQNEAFLSGHSKKQYPGSKHNDYPSSAIDVAPTPLNWTDRLGFYYFAGYVMCVAQRLNLKIRWGGQFDVSTTFENQKFKDLVHFELK